MQVLENIKKEQLEIERKKAQINIYLNEYGIYVAKLRFLNNELSLINNKIVKKVIEKRKIRNKTKIRKTYKGYETYNGNNKTYGQYKATKTYQPI